MYTLQFMLERIDDILKHPEDWKVDKETKDTLEDIYYYLNGLDVVVNKHVDMKTIYNMYEARKHFHNLDWLSAYNGVRIKEEQLTEQEFNDIMSFIRREEC